LTLLSIVLNIWVDVAVMTDNKSVFSCKGSAFSRSCAKTELMSERWYSTGRSIRFKMMRGEAAASSSWCAAALSMIPSACAANILPTVPFAMSRTASPLLSVLPGSPARAYTSESCGYFHNTGRVFSGPLVSDTSNKSATYPFLLSRVKRMDPFAPRLMLRPSRFHCEKVATAVGEGICA